MGNRFKNRLLILNVALISQAIVGCTDSQTAYETYVACDQKVRGAESLSDVTSCYTKDRQQWLHAQEQAYEDWFSQFKGARPVIARVHEEQLTDVDDESILLIVGHTQQGQPAEIQVKMLREGRAWKIDYESSQARGAAGTEAKPISVSLGPFDGAEWNPGELHGHAGRRSDGTCSLKISHVFQFPNVRVVANCERLTTPGTYQLDELASEEVKNSESYLAAVWDQKHVWHGADSGELTITAVDDGAISGEFRFETSNPSDRLAVSGTFSNLPFDAGD